MADPPARPSEAELTRQVGLVELVNRVLDRGAVVSGEVVIGVAGVDLLYLGLQLVLTSVETMRSRSPALRSAATPSSPARGRSETDG